MTFKQTERQKKILDIVSQVNHIEVAKLAEMVGVSKVTLRSEIVRDMAKQVREVIILTESEKFSKQGMVPLLPFNSISTVFTDDLVPPEKEKFLTEQGIKVYKVAI